MKVHDIKCAKPHFQGHWDRLKRHEIRLDDRDYQAGDVVVLRETESIPLPGVDPVYTGRWVMVDVVPVAPVKTPVTLEQIKADKRFAEGRIANENGDKFDLAAVLYTIALFFAGVGLVFKSNTRWAMFGIGFVLFIGVSIFMSRLPWAG